MIILYHLSFGLGKKILLLGRNPLKLSFINDFSKLIGVLSGVILLLKDDQGFKG